MGAGADADADMGAGAKPDADELAVLIFWVAGGSSGSSGFKDLFLRSVLLCCSESSSHHASMMVFMAMHRP